MSDIYPLEFYANLLQAVKGTSDSRIPVRIHPTAVDGQQQHWLRGNLVDTTGRNLVIVPLHGKQSQKQVPPDKVKLWDSRMSSGLLKVVERLKKEQKKNDVDAVKATITNPLFQVEKKTEPVKVEAKPIPAPTPVETLQSAVETEDIEDVEEPIQDESEMEGEEGEEEMTDMEVESPPTPTPAPSASGGFSSKLSLLKQKELELQKLKEEVARNAHTEGLKRLRDLQTELVTAREMVVTIQDEIIQVCQELAEFGVEIPADLRAEMQSNSVAPTRKVEQEAAIPPPSTPTPPTRGRKKAVPAPSVSVVDDEPDTNDREALFRNRNNWCPNKAQAYKPQIIEYFKKNENFWTSGVELMRHVGETVTSPSNILLPLVLEDTLERIGRRPNVRYRLKEQE